jgi:hypothetical protein
VCGEISYVCACLCMIGFPSPFLSTYNLSVVKHICWCHIIHAKRFERPQIKFYSLSNPSRPSNLPLDKTALSSLLTHTPLQHLRPLPCARHSLQIARFQRISAQSRKPQGSDATRSWFLRCYCVAGPRAGRIEFTI